MTPKKSNEAQKQPNSKSVDLVLAIDFGGSLTKIVGGISATEYVAMTMEPEVVEVTEAGMKLHEKNAIGAGRPKDRAWVKVDGKVYAVGYLARQFLGDAALWKPKTEIAVPKLLAALWVLKRYWNDRLGTQRLKVAISCVLPPGEYTERAQFEAKVREALKRFGTPDGYLTMICRGFFCFPEGFGVLSNLEAKIGQNLLKTQEIAIIMMGHRNSSLMVSNRGRVTQFESSPLGFIQLVRKVRQRTAGLEESSLSEAIALAGKHLNPTILEGVLRHQDPAMRKQELADLIEAISVSREEYQILLGEWIQKTLPSTVTEVFLCGGTADYLADFPMLSGYKLSRPGDIQLPAMYAQLKVGNRMADVAGLWEWTLERSFPPQTHVA